MSGHLVPLCPPGHFHNAHTRRILTAGERMPWQMSGTIDESVIELFENTNKAIRWDQVYKTTSIA